MSLANYFSSLFLTNQVDSRMNFDDLDEDENTGLFLALFAKGVSLVKLLLEDGVDPNIRNLRGSTALGIACFHNNFETVRLLLDYNADASLCNNYGSTPLMLACTGNATKSVQLLLRNCPDVSSVDLQWHHAMSRASSPSIKLLLKHAKEKRPVVSLHRKFRIF